MCAGFCSSVWFSCFQGEQGRKGHVFLHSPISKKVIIKVTLKYTNIFFSHCGMSGEASLPSLFSMFLWVTSKVHGSFAPYAGDITCAV
jgi:hypothetical protein